ncbi:peptidoglycan DD-metalloendopeptidase family protein [Dasania marina]|uniref:M23 family metallopeptidase n=1 Tax=Dasania marina TaxID=471499 RepID=UPI0030D8502D|tara:strand:+ start:37931 stop:38857 length:927 start_codon:yes stop_codon:yes gene_type:complete
MKVIIVNDKHAESKTLSLGLWTRTLLSLCLLGAPLATGIYLGYQAGHDDEVLDHSALQLLKDRSEQQQQELSDAKRQAEQQLQALTLRMAELQSRLVRLDALGERVTTIAKLDKGEFDFSQMPALGGPETDDLGQSYSQTDFVSNMDELLAKVDNRAQQLEILETLLANRKIQDDIFLAGRPIKKGWMSSRFGHRADPFTGRAAIHEGVDFAGKEGSAVISVAAGVVTWADKRYGYGQMVEVNHGGGYVTRYGHNKEHLVKVGDIVKKGQEIALMGSTGRSTGPHVHFEVYKHGRAVDPAAYIHRTNR